MRSMIVMLFAALAGICTFASPTLAQEGLGMLGFGKEASASEQEPLWHFSLEQAKQIGESIGINWTTAPFSVKQFRVGLEVELEHGSRDPKTDVTHDDPLLTGKIALAHISEDNDYYYKLALMEGNQAYFDELIGTSKP